MLHVLEGFRSRSVRRVVLVPFLPIFLVATRSYSFYHCRSSAHACGFNIHFHPVDVVISSHIPQPFQFLVSLYVSFQP